MLALFGCILMSPVPPKLQTQPVDKKRTLITLSQHFCSSSNNDCLAVETQPRTPSLPSPPPGLLCPWVRAAQMAILLFSVQARWPPGEIGPEETILPPNGRPRGCSFVGVYSGF
ncbi:hypothetical protein XENORESO_018288 [Xenotaenia resolanae]|uniref:Uncharacterized protein n=1 Tax=Xenotaenia resolanae TaxID=208358 RepID=A0ABV0WNJ4_9TELE